MAISLRAKAGFAGFILLGGLISAVWMLEAVTSMPSDGEPCVRGSGAGFPLLVGDTMTFEIGERRDSSCDPAALAGFRWTSSDSLTVQVEASGRVRGIRPGDFEVVAIGRDTTLYSDGFVLPPGWRLATTPDSATAFVGDSVLFHDFATDSAGGRFPVQAFSRNRFLKSRWVRAERPGRSEVGIRLRDRATSAVLVVPGGGPGGTVQLFTRFEFPLCRASLISLPTHVADSLRQMAVDLLKLSTPVETTNDRLWDYGSGLDGQRLVVTPERPLTIRTTTGEVALAQLVVVIPTPGRSPSLMAMRDGGWIDAYSGLDSGIVNRMRSLAPPGC